MTTAIKYFFALHEHTQNATESSHINSKSLKAVDTSPLDATSSPVHE